MKTHPANVYTLLRGYGFFWILSVSTILAFIVLGTLFLCVTLTVEEFSIEAKYETKFGADWPSAYERDFGSLDKARMKIVFRVLGALAIPSAAIWVVRSFRGRPSKNGPRRLFRRTRSKFGSHSERILYCRRKALLRIYFGIPAILIAAALVLFDWGIFVDPDVEIILGICVFILGYVSVLNGCSWWLKAKCWDEAVLLIGVLPIAVLFIPIVRVILLPVLPIGMVLMPLILVIVIWTLQDKSGVSTRVRGSRRRDEASVNRQ